VIYYLKFEKHSGTIKEVGAFQIILENEEGKTVIIPTKSIFDKDIIVESGPAPETPEKKMQKMVEQAEKDRRRFERKIENLNNIFIIGNIFFNIKIQEHSNNFFLL
jgi:small-conductance mechanosensitive channel